MDLHSDGADGSSIEEDIRDELSLRKDNDNYRYTVLIRATLCVKSYKKFLLSEATTFPKRLKNVRLVILPTVRRGTTNQVIRTLARNSLPSGIHTLLKTLRYPVTA